ncbi:hypothetical protein [Actinoplanes sp. DH11]|uniref:MGH1-like glycoside hydrolase domain-containing protein n=1 Tax=Actinoplanes sp. DH11 TaxID=2857011 RepID=UPI001E295B01|nr:hypothetical protein [Actinoplanes sp. DH11]
MANSDPGAEQRRLHDADTATVPWRRWGPYLSERQWGTVREDYSPGGDAWNFLSHDAARSRAYRWGEDGIAGFCDEEQSVCLALAMWNGRDPILKERFFGLTNTEGNHGEDAKEYWFYVDATPTHSYQKMIYKYPQREFPYADLVGRRTPQGRVPPVRGRRREGGGEPGRDRHEGGRRHRSRPAGRRIGGDPAAVRRRPGAGAVGRAGRRPVRHADRRGRRVLRRVLRAGAARRRAAGGPPGDRRDALDWSKQYFGYDVERWLTEHGRDPLAARDLRNGDWFHMICHDVISMPDTWEYPWFAAWDLAFHTVALALVDLGFAKAQLELLLSRRYLHPSGQIPAYEWNFSDVNPPVHAWATHLVHEMEKARTGRGDHAWLEAMFHKLAKNFTWWVNRKDHDGNNIFQGGFLGLDNIGVFDRSAPLPTGGHLDQADGTAWMALYCQSMLTIALELSERDPVYAEQAQAYFEHFAWIAVAVNHETGSAAMWDEEDGFFYDLLRLPDGSAQRLRVRSLVGLLPLAAVTVHDPALTARHPGLVAGMRDFVARHPSVRDLLTRGRDRGEMLALFDEDRLRRILSRLLDEDEFLSPYGIRSLSRHHAEHPFALRVGDRSFEVRYRPAESDSAMFGGNSNWRGPIWFPANVLLIRALLNLHQAYGDALTVECPTDSGVTMDLFEVARELTARQTRIFLPTASGERPCYGGQRVFATEHWRDLILFSEYFHGDNGAGLGAAHQTGWTGLVALYPNVFAGLTGTDLLDQGMAGMLHQLPGTDTEERK